MKVFKFGGATVSNAKAIRQLASIVKSYPGNDLVVVVSAMDKTTNALEGLIKAYYNGEKKAGQLLDDIRAYHYDILPALFPDEGHAVYGEVSGWFEKLQAYMETAAVPRYDFEYDQIICFGELVSTTIVYHYLNDEGLDCKWFDARKLIRTDTVYQDANVDWNKTAELITRDMIPFLSNKEDQGTTVAKIAVTQGFIGGAPNDHSTSLGREGSDYSAAIFAYVLNADEVIIWKDVPGILNADPRYYKDTVKIDELSYREALELSYFGAKIIHPKTIKPLQNKQIPLTVKPFDKPEETGSSIMAFDDIEITIPSFMVKTNQVLISFSPLDFSFISADHLHHIFGILSKNGIKINLMQNSAISFSICVNGHQNLDKVLDSFQSNYSVKYNTGLHLITIRRYNDKLIKKVVDNREILLEQKSRKTARLVVKI